MGVSLEVLQASGISEKLVSAACSRWFIGTHLEPSANLTLAPSHLPMIVPENEGFSCFPLSFQQSLQNLLQKHPELEFWEMCLQTSL